MGGRQSHPEEFNIHITCEIDRNANHSKQEYTFITMCERLQKKGYELSWNIIESPYSIGQSRIYVKMAGKRKTVFATGQEVADDYYSGDFEQKVYDVENMIEEFIRINS